MENQENKAMQLPENAFRELKEGEQYEPCLLYTSPSPRD